MYAKLAFSASTSYTDWTPATSTCTFTNRVCSTHSTRGKHTRLVRRPGQCASLAVLSTDRAVAELGAVFPVVPAQVPQHRAPVPGAIRLCHQNVHSSLVRRQPAPAHGVGSILMWVHQPPEHCVLISNGFPGMGLDGQPIGLPGLVLPHLWPPCPPAALLWGGACIFAYFMHVWCLNSHCLCAPLGPVLKRVDATGLTPSWACLVGPQPPWVP